MYVCDPVSVLPVACGYGTVVSDNTRNSNWCGAVLLWQLQVYGAGGGVMVEF